MSGLRVIVLLFVWSLLPARAASAQQPFYTDDAEVTAHGNWHAEVSNQLDFLKRSSYPSVRQNTTELEVNFGLRRNLEIGVASPLLAIFEVAGTQPRTAVGLGDTSVSVKYRMTGTPQRAFALSLNFEIPTGSREQQLGSGVADFGLNTVWQEQLLEGVTVRANGGLLLAGNTLAGVVGIPGRGLVVLAGGSVTHSVRPTLLLGIELTGAFTPRETQLARAQVQAQLGGNYTLRDGLTVDFGVLSGWSRILTSSGCRGQEP